MLAPPELRAVHPLGKAPIVVDDGTVLIESGAIIEYAPRPSRGLPAASRPPLGTPDHLAYLTFLHFAEGLDDAAASASASSSSTMARESASPRAPARPRHHRRRVETLFVRAESDRHPRFSRSRRSPRRTLVCGGHDLSGADIQMSFPDRNGAPCAAASTAHVPKLMDFLARIHARLRLPARAERGSARDSAPRLNVARALIAKSGHRSLNKPPVPPILDRVAAIAQLVEHLIRNEGVGGSNPSCGTTLASQNVPTCP